MIYLHHGMGSRDSLLVLAHSTGCGRTSWMATSSRSPACGALWPYRCGSYGTSLSLSPSLFLLGRTCRPVRLALRGTAKVSSRDTYTSLYPTLVISSDFPPPLVFDLHATVLYYGTVPVQYRYLTLSTVSTVLAVKPVRIPIGRPTATVD